MDIAAIFRSITLPPSVKLVAAYLEWLAGEPGIEITANEIAENTGLSERAVRSALRSLENEGAIRVNASPGEANRITLTPAKFAAPPRQNLPPTPAKFAAPPAFSDKEKYLSSEEDAAALERTVPFSQKKEEEFLSYAAATLNSSFIEESAPAGGRAHASERMPAPVCEDVSEPSRPRRSRRGSQPALIDLARELYAARPSARFATGGVLDRATASLASLEQAHGREPLVAALQRYLNGGDDWIRRERWPLPYFLKHVDEFLAPAETGAATALNWPKVLDAMIEAWNAAMPQSGPLVDASLHLHPGMRKRVEAVASIDGFREKWVDACCRIGYAHYAFVNYSVRRLDIYTILTKEGLESALGDSLEPLLPWRLPSESWPICNAAQKVQHWQWHREALIAMGYKSGVLPPRLGESFDSHRSRYIATAKAKIDFNV